MSAWSTAKFHGPSANTPDTDSQTNRQPSSTLVTSARDGSIERLSNRDLTSSRGILVYVVLELRHFLRKLISVVVSLSCLGLKLDNSSHELQDFVLDLSILARY